MIIGAAPTADDAVFREFPPENYYVICADAGYETAKKFNITPDLIVGDFDSAKNAPPQSRKVVTIPVQKDLTDTMFAVIRGLAKGVRNFVLVGCLGGDRFDHSIGNLEVLRYILDHNCRGVIADSHTKVFLLQEESRLTLTKMKGATVSVLPYGEPSCNVSYKGLFYPLERRILTTGNTLGLSNSITDDVAEIRVHWGTALIIVYQP